MVCSWSVRGWFEPVARAHRSPGVPAGTQSQHAPLWNHAIRRLTRLPPSFAISRIPVHAPAPRSRARSTPRPAAHPSRAASSSHLVDRPDVLCLRSWICVVTRLVCCCLPVWFARRRIPCCDACCALQAFSKAGSGPVFIESCNRLKSFDSGQNTVSRMSYAMNCTAGRVFSVSQIGQK